MKTIKKFLTLSAILMFSTMAFAQSNQDSTAVPVTEPVTPVVAPTTPDTAKATPAPAAAPKDQPAADQPGPSTSGQPQAPQGSSIYPKPTKLIALTFDDGPNTITTPKILALVKQYGVHFTFFCIANQINKRTSPYLKELHGLGCEIANHTWDHPFMTRKTPEEQLAQIEKANAAIRQITGKNPVLFRPPYIDCNQKLLDNLDLIFVSGLGSDDWITTHTPQMIANQVLNHCHDGSIVVMHDFVKNTRTPIALKTIIPELLKRGYKLVTVSELFKARGITPQKHKMYVNLHRSSSAQPAKKVTTKAKK